MRVLFLYTELADYFIKCCEELVKHCEVAIVRWPVNKEAPFKFAHSQAIQIYNKQDYTFTQLKNLVDTINPDVLVCSGWIDKDYLRLVKPYFKKIPTVLACDTQWKGSFKQYMAVMISRFFLLNKFSHAWVPGQAQSRYLEKLGFKTKNISTGFYSCNLPQFNKLFEAQREAKQKTFPKKFLYVGRYYDFKGIRDLWEAFMQLQNEEPCDWELWCLGTGDLKPAEHPRIRHFGFVQPADLAPVLAETGVFILPSRFEPWGVVVQEYAASGFPLLLSSAVGAKEAFLEEGKNGFSFLPQNSQSLKKELKKIMNLSPEELILMGEESHRLAQKISPDKWANTVLEIHHGTKK